MKKIDTNNINQLVGCCEDRESTGGTGKGVRRNPRYSEPVVRRNSSTGSPILIQITHFNNLNSQISGRSEYIYAPNRLT